MKFYDELKRKSLNEMPPIELEGHVVVDAANVRTYFSERYNRAERINTKTAYLFPKIKLPFIHTFIEFQSKGWSGENINYKFGLAICENLKKGNDYLRYFGCMFMFNDGWLQNAFVGCVNFSVNEEFSLESFDFSHMVGMKNVSEDYHMMWRLFLIDQVSTCLLSISLMNCKNVTLIENAPPPKLAKKHMKKHGHELTKYYTLKVTPMKKVFEREENPQAKDKNDKSLQPLHIARGHFKDYRNGGGLFGKYKEVFWWDAHFRGSKENGEIVKDYKVTP